MGELKSLEEDSQKAGENLKKMNSVVLTTAPAVAGNKSYEEIEIITAECVFGMNVFRDLFAGVRDLVGGVGAKRRKMFLEMLVGRAWKN